VSVHSHKAPEIFKTFRVKYMTVFKRALDPVLKDHLSKMRDLENTTPLSDGTLIRQLKLQTATEEDLQGRWKDAMMCVQSNKERFMMNEQIVFRKALEFRDVVITWDNEITLPIDIPNEIEAAIRTKFSSVLRGVFLKNAPIMLTSNVSPILHVANGTPAVLHSLTFSIQRHEPLPWQPSAAHNP
jgi:hypothetical protein